MRFLDRFIWAKILKTCMNITISKNAKVRLVTTVGAQLLDTFSYVETSQIGALVQAKMCFLGVNMINKNSVAKQSSVEMERLSKGENIAIHLNVGEQIDLLLSNHRCMIVGGETNTKFIDESGNFYSLKSGKNIIGRGSSSDIVLSQKLRDISRMHMVIEEADTANNIFATF